MVTEARQDHEVLPALHSVAVCRGLPAARIFERDTVTTDTARVDSEKSGGGALPLIGIDADRL